LSKLSKRRFTQVHSTIRLETPMGISAIAATSKESERRTNGLGRTPSVYLLKPAFQGWLRPLAGTLADLGISANQVTLFACAVSVGFGQLLIISHARSRAALLLFPFWLFVRMALNALDGILAREFGQESALGAYLNELGDVVSDAFLYLSFVFWPEFDPRWMAIVLVLAVVSEMAGVVGVMTGDGRRYDGPMGKSDRALIFGAWALWCGLGWRVAPWAAYLFPRFMVSLLIITVVNRVRKGLIETKTGGFNG
jgi:CDP-diacylglycerol--glycerol-3-phosphate 3-phosphatidyltransferase